MHGVLILNTHLKAVVGSSMGLPPHGPVVKIQSPEPETRQINKVP